MPRSEADDGGGEAQADESVEVLLKEDKSFVFN